MSVSPSGETTALAQISAEFKGSLQGEGKRRTEKESREKNGGNGRKKTPPPSEIDGRNEMKVQ